MSKIYEALLQAEQERVGAGVEETPGRRETADFLETSGLDTIGSGEPSSPAGSTLSLPMKGTQVRGWSPLLEKLPALQGRGRAAEQFRSLRSRMYEYRGFERLRTVLVSSGLPQEGKSFVAANLALSLARYQNSQVLLIDGDLRRSSLHQLLGCSPEPGLAEYLAGKAELIDVLQRAEVDSEVGNLHTAFTNLTFLPGGKGGDNVFDLSGNKRFEELLIQLAPHFDWVIVDSSPVNLVADAVNLACSCDGVLLVARHGVTRYETLQQAQGELKASKILGVVLNGAPETTSTDGYYGYGNDSE